MQAIIAHNLFRPSDVCFIQLEACELGHIDTCFVLGSNVHNAGILYCLCLCLFSAIEHVLHDKALQI